MFIFIDCTFYLERYWFLINNIAYLPWKKAAKKYIFKNLSSGIYSVFKILVGFPLRASTVSGIGDRAAAPASLLGHLLPHGIGPARLGKHSGSDSEWILSPGHKRHDKISLTLLDSSVWGRSASTEDTQTALGRHPPAEDLATWWWPASATATWARCFISRSPSPSQAFQPTDNWKSEPSPAQIPSPLKSWDNKWLLFWATKFGGDLLHFRKWIQQQTKTAKRSALEGSQGFAGHCKFFGFYFQWYGDIESSELRNDMIWSAFQQDSSGCRAR